MSNPLYPDVPNLPGVPPVFRSAANPLTAAPGTGSTPLTRDAAMAVPPSTAWGLYTDKGALALQVDSIVAIEPNREFRISDYPVEQGGFASYNKVATPQELRVTVAKGGTNADRNAFLTVLDTLVVATGLYNVVTPDTAFVNFNLVRYDYRRNAGNGATLLIVELQMIEVRQSVQTKYVDSKAPNGADLRQDGPVQPAIPALTQLPLVGPR